MIEVLKRGEIPEDRIYEAVCKNCRSSLRFKRSEARNSTDERDGDAIVIDCPVCAAQVWTSEGKYKPT